MSAGMTEHMKGPWQFVETISPGGQEWLGCGVVAGDNFQFVWLDDDPETDTPTARLIAAAPDMLEALEAAQAILNPMSGFVKRGDAKAQKHLEDRREMIRAVIATAKGGDA